MTHTKKDNETGVKPGQLIPFAPQPNSVASYCSFSRQPSKVLATKIFSFLSAKISTAQQHFLLLGISDSMGKRAKY